MRWVRRLHLFLGLFFFPFVIFFGITGLSFNHPTVGRGIPVVSASPEEVAEVARFRAWRPEAIARDTVAALRDQGFAATFDEDEEASFSGWPLFVGRAPNGIQTATLSLEHGWASFTKRVPPKPPGSPPFAQAVVTLPQYSIEVLGEGLGALARSKDIPIEGVLAPHPRVHPEVRFVVQDENGRAWNVIYDLVSGTFTARPRDAFHGRSFAELLESIHKQHHYPPHRAASFFWSLFADLTAITLLLWALTGLTMWWQLKKLRRIGFGVLALSIVVAALVFGSIGAELTFGPPQLEGPS